MNKNRKTLLNTLLGIGFMALLLWIIMLLAKERLTAINLKDLWKNGDKKFLLFALLLLPMNVFLEAGKWKLLASSAQKISFLKSLKSVLVGMALSLLTPNRIGEYPARIAFLKKQNTGRLIAVSFLGAFAQFITLFCFGITGLVWFNFQFPELWLQLLLGVAFLLTVGFVVLFLKFEFFSHFIERIKWFRRFGLYTQLLRRFTLREELTVLLFSISRFGIYTAQYLALLFWMRLELPLFTAFMLSNLFFWAMAVMPSIAFAELGIRGGISLFLFGAFTENTSGVLSATLVLWFINVLIPAVCGALLLLKIRLLKD